MQYPTPEDPHRAPVWENYVSAQAAQAALGCIPGYVHALGVEIDGTSVTLVVQASPGVTSTDEEIADIVSELEALLGPDVRLCARVDETDTRHLDPHDGITWFFAALQGRWDTGATAHLGDDVSGAIRNFAYFMAAGSVGGSRFDGDDDYRPVMLNKPSLMEAAFAVYANVLEVDQRGVPLNAKWAEHRAAQWVLAYMRGDWTIEPPFEPWEVELHSPPPRVDPRGWTLG